MSKRFCGKLVIQLNKAGKGAREPWAAEPFEIRVNNYITAEAAWRVGTNYSLILQVQNYDAVDHSTLHFSYVN